MGCAAEAAWNSARRLCARDISVCCPFKSVAYQQTEVRVPREVLARRGCNGTILARQDLGGVVEWLMAPVLKTGRAQALVGSNPTPSALAGD